MSQRTRKSGGRPSSRERRSFRPVVDVIEDRIVPGKTLELLDLSWVLPTLLTDAPWFSALSQTRIVPETDAERKRRASPSQQMSPAATQADTASTQVSADAKPVRQHGWEKDGTGRASEQEGPWSTQVSAATGPWSELSGALASDLDDLIPAKRPRTSTGAVSTDSSSSAAGVETEGGSGGGFAGRGTVGGEAPAPLEVRVGKGSRDFVPEARHARKAQASIPSPSAPAVPASPAQPQLELHPETPSVSYDADLDGVPREIEARAPHRGDRNRDGKLDESQPDVASVRAATNGRFITIEALGHTLKNVQTYTAPRHTVDGFHLSLLKEIPMPKESYSGPLEQVNDCCWRIPKSYKEGMRVDGLIYADENLIEQIKNDQAPEQVANVAFLPGIQHASLAMPDIHWGYGFCIGGVCATDPEEGGVISPGGVGYDINCGVRLVRSNLFLKDVQPRLRQLIEELFREVPTGVGRSGKYRFDHKELRQLMEQGSRYLLKRDLAVERDIEFTEAHGRLDGAEPGKVSDRALDRGAEQCGTLGSGNHFLEVQVVDAVFDEEAAGVMGLAKDMVCIMIHSGSRGLGYQVCDDALHSLRGVPEKYGIALPDRQLACAPVHSKEGAHYLGAMRAAANFAWCNRQLLMWQARECFATVFGKPWQQLQMNLIYDVAHNIAKFEEHTIGGEPGGVSPRRRRLWVHRKGATRAFPPNHPEIPPHYQRIGQPVIIPGDMGRASWVLAGQAGSMEQTFGTTCHGAGRAMSRTAAVKAAQGRRIDRELEASGVIARARSWKGLAEEQPKAYKDVDLVVEVVHKAGISKKVARMRPIGVIKG